MYKYTFVLNTGQKDHIVGDTFQDVLYNYFQGRGMNILSGATIQDIEVSAYPNGKGSTYHVSGKLIEKIVAELRKQNAGLIPRKKPAAQFTITPKGLTMSTPPVTAQANQKPSSAPAQFATVEKPVNKSEEEIQQERCAEMKKTCPEGSNDVDPIMMYEDWCDDVPYKEFVKQDKYLSNCYRLSNIINTFNGGLLAEKGGNPLPQWPVDPYNKTAIPPERLVALYNQAKDAKIDIPEIFAKFIDAMVAGLFDIDVAMKGPYIGLSDQINPKYITGFVQPAVDVLFSKRSLAADHSSTVQTQEEKDLQMAIQLAEQFGYE